MKIISYKNDNEAYAKRLQNCEKVATVQGFDFYRTANEDGTVNYYGHIVGITDLCECILSYSYTPLDEFIRMTEQLPTAKLDAFLTIDGKLERIRQAIASKQWTSNGDAFFCELVGDTALAEEVRQNRSEYQVRQAQAEAERREQAEQRERERMEAEQREKAKRLEQAEGYLLDCPDNVQIAIEKMYYGGWKITELTTGFAVADYYDTRKEAIEKAYAVAPTIRKCLKNPRIRSDIEALKTYAEQQQRITA